ncbi:glutaredoxin [Gordonia phage Schmidt]|uniref:Glutaredoxin n=1 Tax=Gordonia phage Schmidt TaxID=2301697 RepID=A0A385E2M4_9CAUD|nr:thioredoxin domain [Gordonia phage Schmidt]AXQ65177.1 glutaredoxin [Gordonia phage Schmidt]
MIEVFTKPGCVQCRMTFREMDRLGIEYVPIQVADEDGEPIQPQYSRAQRFALTAMPIVDAGGGNVWGGFKPERIRELVK